MRGHIPRDNFGGGNATWTSICVTFDICHCVIQASDMGDMGTFPHFVLSFTYQHVAFLLDSSRHGSVFWVIGRVF